jgi:ATP-dependent helicase/nuclease subunit A
MATGKSTGRSNRPLKDQAARDKAAKDLETSFIVEAAAGTGKTTLLVSRILNLIKEQRAVPDEIVAITFTERAAAELKIRLQDDLSKALEEAARESQATVQHLADALWGLERMQVTTIHSFCAALIRERPVEAGVDPNFDVADELSAGLMRDEVWDDWLSGRMRRGDDAIRRALAIGLKPKHMRDLADKMLENRDVLGYLPKPQLWSLHDHEFPARIEGAVADMIARATSACRNEDDKALDAIEDLKAATDEVKRLKTDEEKAVHLFGLSLKSLKNKGRQTDWEPTQCLKDIRAEMDELRSLHDDFRNWLAHHIIVEIAEDLLAFVDAYKAAMTGAAVLDFQDLLLYARNMLKDHPHVREYFRRRFKYILVDEFQDTDPLQAEIIFFLAEREGAPAAEWEKVKVAPGKLFLVGDPKQSIYRFRRADIEMYDSARRSVGKDRDLSIFQNFRCAMSLVSVVNEIFRDLIEVPPDGAYQPEYVALEFGRKPEEVPPKHGVYLMYPPQHLRDEMPNVDERRKWETRAIAAFIQKLVREHKWKVWDKNEKRQRPVELRDIAVLLRSHKPLAPLEDAFNLYGVDYRVIGGRFFFMRQEVQQLLAVFRAVDNPYDGVALVAALRSPFFGVSDEDMFEFHAAGGPLNYLDGAERAAGTALEPAFRILWELHEKRNDMSPEDLLRDLYQATKAPMVFLLKPGGEQRVHNLMKIADVARALAERGVRTFRAFVEWLSEREEQEADEAEAATVETGDNFVRVLTVHKAKGLEFPIVILADLASGKQEREPFIVDRRDSDIAILMGAKDNGIRTLGYDERLLYEAKRLEAEERRLLYVAMTRARDLLVVPAYWTTPREIEKETGEPKEGRLLHYLAGKIPHPGEVKTAELVDGADIYYTSRLDFEPEEPEVLRVATGEKSTSTKGAEKQSSEWQHKTEELTEIAKAGRTLRTATEAVKAGTAEAWKPVPSLTTKPGNGTAFGTLVHSLFDLVDWENPEVLERLAQDEAADLDLPEAGSAEAAKMVLDALRSETIEGLLKSDAYYKEVPFAVKEDGAVLEGKMDVLSLEDGEICVLDFKTDRVSATEAKSRAEHYRPQAEAYAVAAEAACGVSPNDVVFFFLRPMEPVNIQITRA